MVPMARPIKEGSVVVGIKGVKMVIGHDRTSDASLTKHRAMEKHGVLNKEQAITLTANLWPPLTWFKPLVIGIDILRLVLRAMIKYILSKHATSDTTSSK